MAAIATIFVRAVGVLTLLVVLGQALHVLDARATLPNASFQQIDGLPEWQQPRPVEGKTFGMSLAAELPGYWLVKYLYPSDSIRHPRISRLRVIEDGERLAGPAHSGHQEIFQIGGGRISHWEGWIYFSTPDGSDPRVNARVYEIQVPPNPWRLTAPFLALFAVALGLRFAAAPSRPLPELAALGRAARRIFPSRKQGAAVDNRRAAAIAANAARAVAVITLLVFLAQALHLFDIRAALPNATLQSIRGLAEWQAAAPEGHTYGTPLQRPAATGVERYLYPSNSGAHTTISRLRVLEDGAPLPGPRHAEHQQIFQEGAGRFNHWEGWLYFSTPDGSDPRANGRTYEIVASPDPLRLALPLLGVIGILVLCRHFMAPGAPAPEIAAALRARRWIRTWPFPLATLLAIVVLSLIQIFLFLRFGLHGPEGNDGMFYVWTAEQLADFRTWIRVPDLESSALPLTLFRMPGYAFMLLLAQIAAPFAWVELIVAIQVLAAIIAGYAVYRVCTAISRSAILGLVASIVFMISQRGEFDRWLLLDSLYTSLLTVFVCRAAWLAYFRETPRRVDLITGAVITLVLFFMREYALVLIGSLALLLAIIVWQWPRPWRSLPRLAPIYGPLLAATILVVGWNFVRAGTPVLTTGAQDSALFALAEVEARGTPVFTEDTLLDQTARRFLNEYIPAETRSVYSTMWAEHGLTGPELARIVTKKYVHTWLTEPAAMASFVWRNMKDLRSATLPLAMLDSSTNAWLVPPLPAQHQALIILSLIVLPACALVALAFWPAQRRNALIIFSLLAFILAPSLAYAAVHMELRYVQYIIGPIFIILAIAVRAVAGQAERVVRNRTVSTLAALVVLAAAIEALTTTF